MPAYNSPGELAECLAALQVATRPGVEILVVDDGSTDDTPSAAACAGVTLLRLATNAGPAAARNHGARAARGEILLFVDADVVVPPDAIDRVLRLLDGSPEVSAIFGSYNTSPRAADLVSQYRNLLHHFVHQQGNREASTFWAGCGAIRRPAFAAVGGFDAARFPRPSIEDVELGYRLRRAGHRILLDKTLQVTHLKRWTLRSMVVTDVLGRALPWARLWLESGHVPDDLNLRRGQRVAGALAVAACIAAPIAVIRWEALVLSAAAALGVLVLNRRLYGFFFRTRGLRFACGAIALHWLYYLYSVLGAGWAWAAFHLGGRPHGIRIT